MTNPLHKLLVTIDGPKGSGKTELVRELRKRFNHQVYVFDRWVGTCYVMDRVLGRHVNTRRDYVLELRQMQATWHVLHIELLVEPQIGGTRILNRRRPGDELVHQAADVRRYNDVQGLWLSFLDALRLPYVQIDTSHIQQSSVARIAEEWIREQL